MQVRSLVRELRSHMLYGVAKKIFKKVKKIKIFKKPERRLGSLPRMKRKDPVR